MILRELEFQKGEKGKTLRLTIDTEIQKLANELLKDKAGSICVMDIYTGAVIAMHSSPSFDPNLFVFGISQDDWQLIRNDPMKRLNRLLLYLRLRMELLIQILQLDVLVKQKCMGKLTIAGRKRVMVM